jgi:hypothetical protein
MGSLLKMTYDGMNELKIQPATTDDVESVVQDIQALKIDRQISYQEHASPAWLQVTREIGGITLQTEKSRS